MAYEVRISDWSSDVCSSDLGMANIASGLLGSMAGCAMIGQTVINIKSGGRGRLSTLVAGVVLLILVVFLGPWVSQIPMAALVAVMVMVSISTFSWESLRNLASHPPSRSEEHTSELQSLMRISYAV